MDPVFGRRVEQVGGYRLLERLGGGGFGEVYYGEHVNSHTPPAAVKLMHSDLLDSHKESEYRSRFAGEIDFLERLHHPAVPQMFAAEAHASRPWLATAYVAGPTLQTLVEAHGPLPVGAVRALTIRIAEVLELLHSRGRAHRDLNPRNVLVTLDGPHVIDFGLARAVGAQPMTRTGEAVGTLLYMPPERPGIQRGTHYDSAGDVFGLGAIALFAATGHPPYKDFRDLRTGHVDFRGVPADLDSALHQLLSAEPEERPGMAAAMVMLRTNRGPGAPVPVFAEALAPAHRQELARHPARPVPKGTRHHVVPPTFTGAPHETSVSGIHPLNPGGGTPVRDPRRGGGQTPVSPHPPATRRPTPRPAAHPAVDEGLTVPIPVIGPGPYAKGGSRETTVPVTASGGPAQRQTPVRRRPVRERAPERSVDTLWERPLSDWVQYVAATRDGTVLAATADGMLTAMDGHTGYFRWDQRLPGGLHGTPVVDSTVVHAGSADGWLNTLDTATASRALTDRRRIGARVIGCALAPGRVVVAAGSGVVWCFPSAHGPAYWTEPVGAPITTGPVVAEHTVYVGDARGRLHALDLDDGGSVWSHVTELDERPIALSVAGDLVVATGADGGVHAFEATDGMPRWTVANGAQSWACFADAASNAVYTGALDGVVRTYDAHTGDTLTELSATAGIHRSLTHVDGLLVVGGTDGSALAVDPMGGHPIWRHTGIGPVHAPGAAVPGGPVVVGRLDGRVCALPPP